MLLHVSLFRHQQAFPPSAKYRIVLIQVLWKAPRRPLPTPAEARATETLSTAEQRNPSVCPTRRSATTTESQRSEAGACLSDERPGTELTRTRDANISPTDLEMRQFPLIA